MSRAVDWLLIGRYALLISLTALIPVPLLDRWVENYLRRRLVTGLAGRRGLRLADKDIRTLADAPSGGCAGCLWSVVMWPIKKVLRTVIFVWQAKVMADVASELLHRALMLEEALEMGWIPGVDAAGVEVEGDALKVRRAMDSSLASVDTRLFERQLAGVYQDHTNDLNRLVHEATGRARARVGARREDLRTTREEAAREWADAAEQEGLGEEGERLSRAMTAAVRGTGVVPELLQWFRAEMGAERGAPAVAGLLEPVEVLPADEEPAEAPQLPDMTDAEELK